MTLLVTILRDSRIDLRRIGALIVLAGVSNAAILALLNSAAQAAARREISILAGLALGPLIAAFAWSQFTVMKRGGREIEAMIARLRRSLVERVRRADPLVLDRIGPAALHASLMNETVTVSQASNTLMLGVQSAVLIACTLVYVGFLSLAALALAFLVILIASRLHLARLPALNARFQEAEAADRSLLDGVEDLVDGFSELKLNSRARAVMADDMAALSAGSTAARIAVQERVASEFVFTQTLFFLLLGAVVFIVPNFAAGEPETTVKVATAMLFLVGALGALLQAVPTLARAESALAALRALEARLEAGAEAAAPPAAPVAPVTTFESLEIRGLGFTYPAEGDEPGFTVGPIDLTVRRGEIVFVVGGNGSGKSTFLKLLTGLYPARTGTMSLDGVPMETLGPARWRSAFAAVLADYHLFPELYGIDAEPEKVAARLAELGLAGKLAVDDGVFSTLDLSSGQRKRVALAVARLEQRPILVLDEWAAEQDPSFRRRFYREILPAIAAAGTTVIAATHDDHYFDAADTVYRMVEGRLEVIRAGGRSPP